MMFQEWLEEKLREMGWKPADLARAANIRYATLSRILNGQRNAGPDVCLAVARALKVPPEEVFRRAGLLPPLPAPEDDAITKELQDIIRQISPQERLEVLDYARYRYRREQERPKKPPK